MKIIKSADTYTIYSDNIIVYDKLPAGYYTVHCSPKTGWYLEDFDPFVVNEKVYGVSSSKVEKVWNTFENYDRSLGVLLSGDKGIGKSLFAKLLGLKFVDEGYPVIVISEYIPGIADYLNSIKQEAFVLFDEYDKTFNGKSEDRDSFKDPQTEMLSLFDGTSSSKKLFVITCNEIRRLSEYLVNRPGRFHYHFRFEYPDSKSVEEYLRDKLDEKYYSEISKVVAFTRKVDVNYDCLRSIAYEINLGENFEDAIKELNIMNIETERYRVSLMFENGEVLRSRYANSIDMFSTEDSSVSITNREDDNVCYVTFTPSDSVYDYKSGLTIIPIDKIDIKWQDNYFAPDEDEDPDPTYLEILHYKDLSPVCLAFKKVENKTFHYAL